MADKENKQTQNQVQEQPAEKPESKLYNFYGAREAKSGKGVNISLVTGKDDNKEWASVYVKYDADGKVKVKVQDGFVYVKIPLMKDDKAKKDALDF